MAKTRPRHPLILCPLLLIATTIVLLAGSAAPQAPGPLVADLPTLTPGDTWSIRFSDGAWAKRTFLRETAGLLIFEVSQSWADGTSSQGQLHLTRELATVRMLGADGAELVRFAPHSLGLRFPLGAGGQWQDRCERFDLGKPAGTFAGPFQVAGPEDVTAPAGTFRTFRVEGRTFDLRDPARVWRFTHWYAPAARMEVRLRTVEPDGKVTEFELTDFRPAGYVPPPAFRAPRQAGQGPAAFLGIWDGYWKEMILATRLTVESVEGDTASVIYWRGAYVFPGLQRPHQQRAEGRFLDERTLRVPIWDDAGQRWAETIYVLQADGTLAGRWKSGGGLATGTLRKEPR
jgi:hypothetical protein